jgi:hypothetical protein
VTPAPAGHCRNPDEAIRGDFCYYFSPLTYQSWPNARFTCNKRLMDLVSITSPDELSFVWTVMLNARDSKGQHTNNMDVNEHERLSNITLRHKLK